ncbi:phosphatase PAP2 family protein [Hippea maritima]|uniref:Phosphoesterase PA-phosphatase related protein n=1 Tax=Hippea maritima (strain ATCC 700847 / DSM 10411 / MH2) TaxID=760142 RepID=F2LX90_HIPMA|nr:phosphatase PAP2 family protein [Hippea maritima]AEA33148.1 phosphoesterase PA-phosphatase related protein [Hippea maritima DSM 10411]
MKNIRLFDYINLGFYIFMLSITLINYQTIPQPSVIALMYVSIIAATVFLIYNETHNRIIRLLRYFYPYIFIGFVFESLGFIVPYINPHNKDYILIKLDRLILGKDAALIFNIFNIKGFVDYLQLSYLSYYVLPFFVIYYFYSKNKIKRLSYSLFALSLGYYLSYLGYIFLPAIGPRYSLDYLANMPLNGGAIFNAVHQLLNALEHIKQDCFPSGHTEISLLVVLLFWDENRKIALIILPIVLSLILSTLVLRYHYFSDVISGIIIAFLVYFTSKTIFYPKDPG